jgi:single-stranded DNA-binding protein
MQNEVKIEGKVIYDVKVFPMKAGGHIFSFTIGNEQTVTPVGRASFVKATFFPVKVFAKDSSSYMAMIVKGAHLSIEGKLVKEEYEAKQDDGSTKKVSQIVIVGDQVTSQDSGEVLSLDDITF